MYFEHVLFFSQCISFVILANLFNGVEGDLFGNNRWDGGGFSALFKSWQIKPDVKQSQGDQLFGRLPQNPESSYTPPEVILNRGYPVQIQHVTTDDGYILEVHRIPPKVSSRKVVFLQHGLSGSSGSWLINPSSRSLAIMLADKGYDVWLGNTRGNRFSKAHVGLDPKSAEFWKFSWDEIGNYDVPAVIKFILDKTGQSKLSYVGYSLGSAMFFIAMSKHPELNSKIEMMIGLAPLSTFAHFKSYLTLLSPYSRSIARFLKQIGIRGWFDSKGTGDRISYLMCELTYTQARICRAHYSLYFGPNTKNLDLALIPVANSNVFRGTSVDVIAQFAQNYNAGQVFQAYDYGTEGNLQKYGSTKPFQYDLSKVTAPVYIFYGGNDYVVAPEDVEWLLSKLGNLRGSTKLNQYNHGDFLWGTDVKEELYDKVINLLPPP